MCLICTGSTAHAKNAASYRFIPSDCRLLEFDAKSFVEKLSSRRVIFSGDSFVRQVLIAFACLLEHHKLIRHKNIPWASCREKWPCHNAKNCIQCGPHSGFFEFDFSLHSTSPHQPQFKYINEVNGGAHKGELGTLKKGDIFFLAPGIFGTPLKATSNAWGRVTSHMKKNVSVVWVHTWPAHFPTADGEYHVEELLLRNNSATNHTNSSIRQTSASTCVDKSDFERKSVEAHFLEQKKQLILGTLWLNGIEKLGMAKVSYIHIFIDQTSVLDFSYLITGRCWGRHSGRLSTFLFTRCVDVYIRMWLNR